MYNFGLIGNCQVSALVERDGTINWLCMPRLDSPPIFGRLLDTKAGYLESKPQSFDASRQAYLKNTNILVTEFDHHQKPVIKIKDFCPRFEQHGRMYRPASVFRIIEPLETGIRINVKCNPIDGWNKTQLQPLRGNSHIRYEMTTGQLRVVTNIPLTYLLSGESFLLQETAYLAILWDMPLEADLKQVSQDFCTRTEHYWRTWVKHCSIPTLFQEEVIRSALTLKLHCYEDTGAIIAATTTSLPEKRGGVRNWDYRLCWIRDAAFTLNALHQLGHFDEMERFLQFILNIVNFNDNLLPVYSIDQKIPLPEVEHRQWTGYLNSSPVRTNNAAAAQVQNDVYGELILSLAPIFLDERFHHLRSTQLDRTMHWLASKCVDVVGKKDAGLWEMRGIQLEHSFTNLMSWAGLDRWLNLATSRKINAPSTELISTANLARDRAVGRIRAAVVDGSVRNSPSDPSLDASMLLMAPLRFPDPNLTFSTLKAIAEGLQVRDGSGEADRYLLYRYRRQDDFGAPEDPFVVCSFWMAHAYALASQQQLSREIIKSTLKCATNLGLFAEHFESKTGFQLGNFPQTYSHVGLINAAFAASPGWYETL
ncbi:MAG: glycoside hydrolase family 15 protein [Deltaproteobacteria bacterium]|nr:glycoside hydrolase family 15 protein [Deltaproteobacteria bacterium]